MCAFRPGNFDFLAIAMNARRGDSETARTRERQVLSDWIETRFASNFGGDHYIIVRG